MYGRHCARIYWNTSLLLQILVCNNASVWTSSSTFITSTDDGRKGSSERQCRSWNQLFSAALLNTARCKGALHAGNRNAFIFVRRQRSYGYYFWIQDCRMCITTLIFKLLLHWKSVLFGISGSVAARIQYMEMKQCANIQTVSGCEEILPETLRTYLWFCSHKSNITFLMALLRNMYNNVICCLSH